MVDAPLAQRVRSLSNGISTQAPTVRFPSQVEDATNVNFSILDGAVKRHGSEQKFRITSGPMAGTPYRMHLIERDEEEQYIIVYGRGMLRVVDIVNGGEETVTFSGTSTTYINSEGSSPQQPDDLRFLTVGDTTFILNRLVNTGFLDGDTEGGTKYAIDPSVMPHRIVRNVESGSFEVSPVPWTQRNFYEQVIKRPAVPPTQGTFKLQYKGVDTVAYLNEGETGETTDDTEYHIPWDAEASNYVSGEKGDGIDQYLEETNTVGSGKVICIHGPLSKDDIIVEFSRDLKMGDGSPTYPGGTEGHLLSVQNVDLNNTAYVVERGSSERNPGPTLIKKNYPISSMAYYRGRLVLAGRDLVTMSRVDELFNLWIERPSALSDADPIDIQIASTDVAEIENVIPFHGSLLIMTRQGRQYFLEDVQTLSSSTAAISPSTRYETKTDVKPLSVGENLFMVGRAAGYSPLWQYYYDDMADSSKATDISKHVRGLLPLQIGNIAGSTSSQTLIIMADLDVPAVTAVGFTSRATGNWDDYTTWQYTSSGTALIVSDVTAQPSDDVVIHTDHTITIDSDYEPPAPGVAATTTSKLFTFRWWDEGSERVQAAWGEWDYGYENLLDCISVDDSIYLLRRVDNGKAGVELFIDTVGLGDDFDATIGVGEAYPHAIRIDQRIEVGPLTNSGDGANGSSALYGNYTRWQVHLDGTSSANQFWAPNIDTGVLSNGFANLGGTNLVLSRDKANVADKSYIYAYHNDQDLTNTNLVTLNGNYTGRHLFLGRKFTAQVELTRVFMRGDDNNPVLQGRLRLTKLLVDTTNSGAYDIKVETDLVDQPDRTISHNPDGVVTYATSLNHITANGEGTKVFLKAEGTEPIAWTSVEWHGMYSTNIR